MVSPSVERAKICWARAQVFYSTPAFNGEPEARYWVEELAFQSRLLSDIENDLLEAASDKNQLVAAYAMETLFEMGIRSEAFKTLVGEATKRREKITIVTGSFSTCMDLGGLARQIKKTLQDKNLI